MRRRTLRRRARAARVPCTRPRRGCIAYRPDPRSCTLRQRRSEREPYPAAGDALQRLPPSDARPWIWVEPMSSAASTTPGHIDFAAACSPSSAPVTAAPTTSTPPSSRISRVSLIRLMSTTRSGAITPVRSCTSRSVLRPARAPSVLRPQGDSLLLRRIRVPHIALTTSLSLLGTGRNLADASNAPEG